MRRLIVPPFALASLIVAACSDPTSMPTSPGLSAPPAASFATSTSTSVNVTTTVYDTFGGAAVYTGSDDYNGSGFATYVTNTKSGMNGLTSQVFTDGGWQLYLGNQSTRTLHLVLAGQSPPVLGVQGTAIPDGYYYTNVEAYSKCFDQNNAQVNLLNMAAGTSNGNCSFGMDFYAGGTKYKLSMGPNNDQVPGDHTTGRALVTCAAAANGSCRSWTIVPNDTVVNARVANLYHYSAKGLLLDHTGYHNSYNVALAQ